MFVANDPAVQLALATPEETRQLVEQDFEGYYSSAPAQDFAARVFTNNAYVAAQAILFGVLLGLPVVYVLLQNALNVGVAGGLLAANDRLGLFFGLILPHGLLELTAVFVACGLGLKLGWTVVDPGARTRTQALAEEGRAVVSGALGLALVLFVSGLVEGFVTPSGLPTWARIGIGVVVEALFLAWVFVLGRRAVLAGETGRPRRVAARGRPARVTLVLWDLDGTLLRAGQVSRDAFEAAFTHVTGRVPAAGGGRLLRRAAPTRGSPAPSATPRASTRSCAARCWRACPSSSRPGSDRLRAEGVVLPHARATLAALPHVRHGVVTGNLRATARTKVTALGLADLLDLDAAAYGDDGPTRDALVPVALARAGAAAADAWVVGDTPHDLACARAGGVRCLLVATGSHPLRRAGRAGRRRRAARPRGRGRRAAAASASRPRRRRRARRPPGRRARGCRRTWPGAARGGDTSSTSPA